MNVLFIGTRAPYGSMHGHKMGMRTYLKALQSLGHKVVLAAFSVPGDIFDQSAEDLGIETHYLPMPSFGRFARNVAREVVFGRKSINECLYQHPNVQSRIHKLCAQHQIDFVVADMIRTAPYAEATGRPWIIDHEDLLSERYAAWTENATGDENILGLFNNMIPASLRPFAVSLFRKALRFESNRMADRELYWSDRAYANSLRSLDETDQLGRLTRKPVFQMPVSVPIPTQTAAALGQRPMSAVFIGMLTYQPNLDALRAYVRDVLPALDKASVEPPQLYVIGKAPEELRATAEHRSITYLGYVPNLYGELLRHQVFFAPIVSGTGIKTKVIEAMAGGLPTIGLPAAFAGLAGGHGEHYLVAKNGKEFSEHYVRLRDNAELGRKLAANGRALAIDLYSFDAARRILDNGLRPVLPGAIPSAREVEHSI